MKIHLKLVILFCATISTSLQWVQCEQFNEFCRRYGDGITCEGVIFGESTTDYGVFDFGSSNNCSIKVQKSFIPILFDGIFKKWSGISSLTLSDIGLTRIVSDINFTDADQLHTLDLSYNKLTDLSGGNFKFLSGLRHLDLSNNKLTELTSNGPFKGLTNLEYLKLKGNGMKSFSGSPFAVLKKLEKLDLSENDISDYPPDTFSGNVNLKYLQLRGAFNKPDEETDNYRYDYRQPSYSRHGRKLVVRIGSLFGYMKKLEFLDVSQNLISLDVRALSEMKQLRYLNLSSTGLTDDSIQYGQFTYTKKLEILDLSHNQLANFDTEILAFLSNLSQLYLNDNKIHDGFDYRQFESNKNLSYISISDNNWDCKLLTKMLENFNSRHITVDFRESQLVPDYPNVEGIRCGRHASDF